MKSNSRQRNVDSYCVATYMPLELAAKVKTAVEGETIERKRRATTSGKYVRKPNSKRPKVISDVLVEMATERYGKVKISKKAMVWSREQMKKNMAKREKADKELSKKKSATQP